MATPSRGTPKPRGDWECSGMVLDPSLHFCNLGEFKKDKILDQLHQTRWPRGRGNSGRADPLGFAHVEFGYLPDFFVKPALGLIQVSRSRVRFRESLTVGSDFPLSLAKGPLVVLISSLFCFWPDTDLKLLANCRLCKKQADVPKDSCLFMCRNRGTKSN